MEEKEKKDKTGLDRVVNKFFEEYIDKDRVKVNSIVAWFIICIMTVFTTGVLYFANNNTDFYSEKAAVLPSIGYADLSMSVVSPNGGDIWTTNANYPITWVFRGTGNVRIDLFKGGKVSRNIARSVQGDIESYNWTVPSGQLIGEDYKIKISSESSPSVSVLSDAPFSIMMEGVDGSPLKSVDGDEEVQKDYIIDKPGTVIKDQTISVTGSVIIDADDVTLENVVIQCLPSDPPNPDQDGIRAFGVNRLKVHLVVVKNCARYGIYLKDGAGHDIAEGMISYVDKEAVVFNNVNNSWLMGWRLSSGVAIKNGSHDNRVFANVVRGNGQGNNRSLSPFSISADSYQNQIVKNRARDNNKNSQAVISENKDNLWYENVCDEVKGFSNCYLKDNYKGLKGEEVGDYGDPNKFSPRIWTICNSSASAASAFVCDFRTYEMAAKDSRVKGGDVLTLDTNVYENDWAPPLTISKPIWLIGNVMGQKGNYSCDINVGVETVGKKNATLPGVTVTSPGVRIQNLKINLPPVLLPDTEIVNIQVFKKASWETLDEDSRKIMPRIIPWLKPPGC